MLLSHCQLETTNLVAALFFYYGGKLGLMRYSSTVACRWLAMSQDFGMSEYQMAVHAMSCSRGCITTFFGGWGGPGWEN